jgi:hypothetical protein
MLICPQCQPAGDESRVELIKTVYRDRRGIPNRIISSDLYTTSKQFDREKMQLDHDIDWDCPIIFPLTGIRSHLVYLGRIEADIPHDKLFPPPATHREVEARLIFSIKPEGQLLKVKVLLQHENGSQLLKKSYVPAASWTPQSELDLESGRDGLPTSFSRAKRQRRGNMRRHLHSTVNISNRKDPLVSASPQSRLPRSPPSGLKKLFHRPLSIAFLSRTTILRKEFPCHQVAERSVVVWDLGTCRLYYGLRIGLCSQGVDEEAQSDTFSMHHESPILCLTRLGFMMISVR